MRYLILIVILLGCDFRGAQAEEQWAFVAQSKSEKIVGYSIGETDGNLTQISSTKITGSPGAMTVSPNGRYLYAVIKKTGAIAAFRIEDNGGLTSVGKLIVGEDGSYLSLHPNGKYLFASFYRAGQACVVQIKDDGSFVPATLQIMKTDERAHSIALDRSGKYAYVSHTRPNSIHQFIVDPETGKLKYNDPGRLQREVNSGPRHLWFHPNGKFAFGSDEQGSSVTSYRCGNSGRLEIIETNSSVPSGYAEKNSTSDIEVHPNGKFVYVANRGHNTIASFSIDAETGRLSPLEHTPTEPTNRSFNISPNGEFLVAAGQKSNGIRVFRIADDGRLLLLSKSDQGEMPWWVCCVAPPKTASTTTATKTTASTTTPSSTKTKDDGKSDRPNVLILYADDLGFGDLGCYNAKSKIPTPNLDRLAKQGIRFTDGHSSSGICTPSRYALLTGRHHWRDFHGIVNALGGSVFKPERITMPEMLKTKGYRTAAIGKWHLGWDWDAIKKEGAKPSGKGRKKTWGPEAFDWTKSIPDGPLAHGFDHYFGDTVINFPPYCWIEDDKVQRAPDTIMDTKKWKPIKEGNWECRPGPMISDWDPYQNIPTTTLEGIEFIHDAAKDDKPFFLYFAFPAPHAPIIPNDKFDGKSKAGPYGDLVFETDDACGRLLKALEESGQADNTIVIFSADNGPEKYAYARDAKFGHWSAEPFRGLKRDIYEGGHHVPFIIKWPGNTEPGQTSEALVSQIDLMATLAAVVGFELPIDCAEDSHNLLPLIKGDVDSVRTTHVHNTRANAYAIRDGDWLLVDAANGYMSGRNKEWEARHEYPADDKSPVELYNLKDDIGQRKNLASSNSEKVKALQELLATIREQGHSAPRFSKN